MKRQLNFFLALLFVSISFALGAQSYYETPENPAIKSTILEDGLSFIVIGDWGRNGEFHQKPVAREMNIASKTLDAEFVVSVGDNFYPVGVQSTMDPQWKQSFEDIYSQHDLNKPWLIALGNHDYGGSVQAQIDYSNVSRRWELPAPYYTKTFEMEDGSGEALFIVIDTNPFIKKYHSYPGIHGEQIRAQDTKAQLAWLEKVLQDRGPKVRWTVVVGHHPMYSGGKRKQAEETEEIRAIFEPLFSKHKVDVYLTGHEHDLQIIQPKGKHTVQYLSGAASEIRPAGEREGTKFAVSDGGFMGMTLTKDVLRTLVVNGEGKVLFQYDQKK